MMETDYSKFIYALRVCCELVPNLIIYDCTHTYWPTPTQLCASICIVYTFMDEGFARGLTQIAWETRLTASHFGFGAPFSSWLWHLWKCTPTLN